MATIRNLRSNNYLAKQFIRRNTRYRKTTSSGRDLVFYCGHTPRNWNPELFKREGFGGSEEAILNLAPELAKLGWHVTVYNSCGHSPAVDNGVVYRPFWEFNPFDKQDALVVWRNVKMLDLELNARKVYLDLHDAIGSRAYTAARIDRVERIFLKSNFQRSLIETVPDEKTAIIPNGVDVSLLDTDPPIEKDPYLLINTSSPDRSMDVLPDLFRRVKEFVPKARLQWAYGWDGCEASFRGNAARMNWIDETKKKMLEVGIESLGRITQAEEGRLYQKASVLAYPSEFAETDCISVKKAQAAFCVPIATDFGALGESIQFGHMVHSMKTKATWNRDDQFHFGLEGEKAQSEWVSLVVRTLEGKLSKPRRTESWLNSISWSSIAARWNEVLASS
jgi:glycosyltransferase involved in cell wall biosynthesis